MIRVNVASVQQYTLDRLRVSLTWDFEIPLLQKLTFSLIGSDGVDYTDRLQSISESNPWDDSTEASHIDIYLKRNSCLEAGTYQFSIFSDNETIYSSDLKINYMEDVRVMFGTVDISALDTLKVTLIPRDSQNPIYNTKKMLQLMSFSVINSTTGTFFSDNFESMQTVITTSEEPVTEFELKLKKGKTLPGGWYDIRLTTPYKSRTFSIVESREVRIPFMTTTPATIGSAYMVKKTNGTTALNVIFDNFIESEMLSSAERIITNSDGKNITKYFDTDRISTTSNTIAGVSYITNLSIPMFTQYYALGKGKYTIRWTWNDSRIPDVVGEIDTTWVVNELTSYSLFRSDFLNMYLPSPVNILDYLRDERYIVELNGTEINPSGIFGSIDDRHHLQYGYFSGENSDNFAIPILNFKALERGTYTFILYHVANNERVYDRMCSIDFIAALTPKIESIKQTSIDKLTVTLKSEQPIRVIEEYIPKLFDQYGSIEFSNRLMPIADSNIWADKQAMVGSFNIIVSDSSNLTSGSYQFMLGYQDEIADQTTLSLQYMETRKGSISSIEQTSLSTIKISFSETQSRQFLLSTIFNVERKIDGADFTDRFELLENVLKADQGSFSELTIPMDHEDSFPAGRYRISFLYNKTGTTETVYSYDVDLGYMTNNIPYIKDIYGGTTKRIEAMLTEETKYKYIGKYVQSMNINRGKEVLTLDNIDDYMDQRIYVFYNTELQQINVTMGKYMEEDLFNKANFSIIRIKDNVEETMEFAEKGSFSSSGWELETTSLRGIRYVRSFSIPIVDSSATVDRGNYTIEFDWPDIAYMNPVKANVFLEYQLPEITRAEVSNIIADQNKVRLYFEIDEAMQYTFFEDLKLEVLDPAGADVSSYFDSIQNSNNINPSLPDSAKVAMNSFNADMLRMDSVTFGDYQFIFYHSTLVEDREEVTLTSDLVAKNMDKYVQLVYGGVKEILTYSNMDTYADKQVYVYSTREIRESHFMTKIDISHATFPRIATAEQVGIDKIMITLRNSIPRMLIENFNFTFKGLNKVDHTDKFMSIDEASDWPEDVREISSFYIQIKSGYFCQEGSYEFTMLNGEERCDGYIFDIDVIAGASGEIIQATPLNLSTLEIVFREEESTDLFRGVDFYVYDENGNDVSYKFQPFPDSLRKIGTDYFDTVQLSVMDDVKAGTYSFVFQKTIKGEENVIADNTVSLPFMCKEDNWPLLYMLAMTKLGYVMSGDDALILWFSPALERNLFDNAKFRLVRKENEDDDVTSQFEDIHTNGILNTTTRNGIEFISMITLKYANKAPFNRDTYIAKFDWYDQYAYMKNLQLEQSMDYILFAVKALSQISSDTIRMDFFSPVDADFLKECNAIVSKTYQATNDDGVIVTQADFSDQFKGLRESNDFSTQSSYDHVLITMGTRDTKLATITLTEENFNTYIGKRVCLKGGDPKSDLELIANIYTETITLSESNKDSYMGKMVQNAFTTNDVIEKLTEENLSSYIGATLKIYEPDSKWINQEVDIYCSTAEAVLPDGVYRFMIAMEIKKGDNSKELRPAYAGECEVSCFIDETYMKNTVSSVAQTSYDTLQFTFNRGQVASVLNKMNPYAVRIINQETHSYSERFMDLPTANYYTKDVLEAAVTLTNENFQTYVNRKVSLASDPNAEIEYLSSANVEKYLDKEIKVYFDEEETGYYTDGTDKDVVIDQLHFAIRETPTAVIRIGKGMYLPPALYSVGLLYNDGIYFQNDVQVTYMTSTPPKITGAEIMRVYDEKNPNDDVGKPYLHLTFEPVTELNLLNSAVFSIMTNRGHRKNEDGTTSIVGSDVTGYFSALSSSILDNKVDSDGTTLVSQIYIPINGNALLPSGKYHIEIRWPEASFYPVSEYDGGLAGLAKGIQSMRTTDVDTIRIILKDQITWKDLRGMNLSVKSSKGDNVTSLFMSLSESNPSIEGEDEWTDTFYIKVDEGDDVTSDTYTFSINQVFDDEVDPEDDSEEVVTRKATVDMLEWAMTIVYLSGDFPEIVDINNMSTRKYDVIELTEDNYVRYLGRNVLPNTEADVDEYFRLTRKNASNYFGTYMKLFGLPAIDQLTVEFDEDVDSSLINALQVTILDSDDVNITETVYQPYETPSFITVVRLSSIFIQLPTYVDGDEIEDYEVTVTLANGTDISDLFEEIQDSNSLVPDENVNSFYLKLEADAVVYEKDTKDLSIIIQDNEGAFIRGYTYELIMRNYQVDRFMDIAIKPETIFDSGRCTMKFEYTNEPDLEDHVETIIRKTSVMSEYIGCDAQIIGNPQKEVITANNFEKFIGQRITLWQKPFMLNPFNWAGEMPFLCNILGEIEEVIFSDSERFGVKFSNQNLPVHLFELVDFQMFDEDNEPVDASFASIEDSNDFDGATTLADLDEPGIIYIRLEEGSVLSTGIYTLKFMIDIANTADIDDDGEEEESETSDADVEVIAPKVYPPVQYTLWEVSEGFPYMFREMYNSITSIDILGIDRLKINLEREMDISLIKDFQFDVYDAKRMINYAGIFKDIEETNFFGRFLMTANERYILYSNNGLTWDRFDTSKLKRRVSLTLILTENNYTEHLGHNIRVAGKNRPYIVLSEANSKRFLGKRVQLYWYEASTSGASYGFTKTLYHKKTGYYYVLCTNGKILRFNTLGSEAIIEDISYGVTNRKSLNDYVLIDDTIVIVGKDGLILRGTIESDGELNLTEVNTSSITTKNLTAITRFYDVDENIVLIAVGYRGTILKSVDLGKTWETIENAYRSINFTDVYNYSEELEVENEDADVEDNDDEEESGSDEDDIDPTVASTMLPRNTVFITGTGGVLLEYTVPSSVDDDGKDDPDDGSVMAFDSLDTGTSSALYAISSHGNTIVAVGDAGTILTVNDTEDGYDVTEYEDGDFSFALTDVKWCDDRFIVSGSSGQWLSSVKGISWSENSSIYSAPLKSISYIENQYGSKKADYFYLQLAEGQELGAVKFYSGEDEPTLNSSFCASWKSSSERRSHINDIYIQKEFSSSAYRSVKKSFWQFSPIVETYQVSEDDETDIIEEITGYEWVKLTDEKLGVPHNGEFYGRIRNKSSIDETKWVYGTEEPIALPYMTSSPGVIEEVTIESPDTMEGVEFMYPFMKVLISGLNENALHYASYSFVKLNDDGTEGNDYSQLFMSIADSDVLYSSTLSTIGYCIYGNTSAIHFPAGDYILKWQWISGGDEVVIDTSSKELKPLVTIKSIDTDSITLSFNKSIPSGYFISTSDQTTQSPDLNLEIRKFPVATDAIPRDILNSSDVSDLNYFGNFKPISILSTGSQVIFGNDGKLSGVKLAISDTSFIGKAKYMIKFNNPSFESPEVPYVDAVKETEDTIWESSTIMELNPMTTEQPVIQNVSFENYYPIPSTKDDDVEHINGSYSGNGNPSTALSEMVRVWVNANSTSNPLLQRHVGDRYTDEDTGDVYYFVKDKSSLGYGWEKAVQSPHLVITFSTYIMKEIFESYTNGLGEYIDFTLDEWDKTANKSITNLKGKYWKCGPVTTGLQSTDYWKFDTINYNGGKAYSKIYIPLNDTVSFPGGGYCKFTMKFRGNYYNTIEYTGFSLPSAIRTFGGIKSISPFNPSSKDTSDSDAGFVVTFEKQQQKAFLQGLTLTLTHRKKFTVDLVLSAENYSEYLGSNIKVKGSTASYVTLTKNNAKKFYDKNCRVYWYETVDESGKFGSLTECNSDELSYTDTDKMNQVYFFLHAGEILDHGSYTLRLTGPKLSSDLVEAEQIQALDGDGNPMYDGAGKPIYEEKAVAFTKKISTPWLTTNPPRELIGTLSSSGTSNATLTITFDEVLPPLSSILKDKGNCTSNGKIRVIAYSKNTDFSGCFRGITHDSTKFTYDTSGSYGDSTEKYVKTITVTMANCKALAKGKYNVYFDFAKGSLLDEIPTSNQGYTQFNVANVLVSKLGVFKKTSSKKGRKITLTLKKVASVKTDAALANSQMAKIIGVRSWKALLKKLKLTVKKGSKSYAGVLNTSAKKVKFTSNGVTYSIKKNKLLNPGPYKWGMTYGGKSVITPKTLNASGLIWNKVGKAEKDKRCWILKETSPSGSKKTKVYKSYKKMKKRVDQMKKLNRIYRYQYKLCKQCRKTKLISTKKTKACAEGWDIPYTTWKKKGGVYKFFKDLVKKWYKFRNGGPYKTDENATWDVKFTLTGQHFDKNYNIVKDSDPKKKYVYRCKSKAKDTNGNNLSKKKFFPGFKLHDEASDHKSHDYVSFGCDNFVKKNERYKWSMQIATAKSFPKKVKTKMYFAGITWKGVTLLRGFKSNKKGKQTTEFKKYLKELKKIIKKRKKAIAKCKACKKHKFAVRKNKSYGWNSVMFPGRVRTLKRMKKLPGYLNESNKKGGYQRPKGKKWKKKGWGCGKPKFVWTKTTYKKKTYTKVKCKNSIAADNTLGTKTSQAIYIK